jgi:hypothetical protein
MANRDPDPSRAIGGVDSMSEVIALYLRDVDVTLLRSRLGMSVEERFADLERMQRLVTELRRAGRAARGETT